MKKTVNKIVKAIGLQLKKDKKRAMIILFLSLFATAIQGQANLPTIIPPSPQAAQYNRYGEIPVGHTTGVPQIDIPIYTLSTGWIDIPISISYHASGFRPREIPSPVGLGWVLNAGGMISRSEEMKPDYSMSNWGAEMPIRSASQVDSLKNGTKKFYHVAGTSGIDFSIYHGLGQWEPFFFSSSYYSSGPIFDTRSDRYFYSYLGNNGTARYNVDIKELTPIPYEPIKIEKNGEVFLITDTKGIKYEFTQTETLNGGNTVIGWYLTKITYPGKESDPVVFSYQNGTQYHDSYSAYSHTTQIIDLRGIPVDYSVVYLPEEGTHTSINAISIVYRSPLIQTITWKNTTISFTYATNRQDQQKDRITSISVKYRNNIIKQAVFDNNYYFGNTKNNYRLKLKGITIKGSNTTNEGDNYTFNYYYENIALPNYEYKCHDDYWGYYNGTSSSYSFPDDININQATGNAFVNAGFPHTVYSTDRKPNEYFTKICVLNEIIYPTKGKTVFEYELNKVPNAYEFMTLSDNRVGGLRLKQRTNYSDATTITDIKSYTYEGYPTQVLKNNLFVYGMTYLDLYCNLQPSLMCYYHRTQYPGYFFVGTPTTSLSGWTGSNVFYSKIKEYNGASPYTSEGWTEYNYTEENRYLNNECSWNVDEYPTYAFSKYSDCDKGNIKGLLNSIITCKQNGDTIKKVEKQYQEFSIPSIHTGVRVFQNAIYPKSFQDRIDNCSTVYEKQAEYENFFLNRIYAMDTYAFRDVSLPGKTTEIEYVNGQRTGNKTTTYNYDTKDGKPVLFTPSKIISQNSANETFTNTTIFPYSDSYKNTAPYNTMVSKNMLEYPVEVKTHKGANQFVNQTFTTYKTVSNMILPDIVSTRYRESNATEARITYHNYDTYGNPVYLSKDDATKVVYIWSYRGQYPIAEIKNATYSEVQSAVNNVFSTTIEALSAQTTPNETALTNGSLQNALPNALVTTYIYKPLIGIWKMQDPRKVITEYEYDVFGRLKKTYLNGNPFEGYDYHYKN